MEIPPLGVTPEAAPIEENHQRFENVRRFITLARLAWAEETLQKNEAHDHVIKRAPGCRDNKDGLLKFDSTGAIVDETTDDGYIIREDELGNKTVEYTKAVVDPHGARLIRGFGTPVQKEQDVPARRSEKFNARHREKQANKVLADDRKRSIIAVRYGEAEQVKEGDDWAPDLRFVVPPSASRGLRKQIRKDRRHEQKVVRHTNRLDDRLDRGSAGDTLPGRVRQRRINRARRRVSKLRAKLED